MKLIIVLCLIAKMASVSVACDVGETVKDFDFNKFTGFWYYLYHLSNEYENQHACVTDFYGRPSGKAGSLVTTFNEKSTKSAGVYIGAAVDWDNTGYDMKFDSGIIWNGKMYVIAIDYDRFFIGKVCSDEEDTAIIDVAFRNPHPDEGTKRDMQKALRDNGIDINELVDWNTENCWQDL